MKDLTIIIPIHEYDKKISKHLESAILSIDRQKKIDEVINVLIVHDEKIKDLNIKNDYKSLKIDYLPNKGDTSYQGQVNYAVKQINTKYFSVLEFDDELSDTYIKNVKKHIIYYPDVEIFMALIIEVNSKNEALKLTNELVWSQQSAGENGTLGYLNTDSLSMQSDFKLSGAVIEKEAFEKIGGYKSNIQFMFMYEFLLRALENGLEIMTIPKVIYKHLLDREGSLFHDQLLNLSIKEKRFWYETARKEYNFNTDREIDLTPIQNKEE